MALKYNAIFFKYLTILVIKFFTFVPYQIKIKIVQTLIIILFLLAWLSFVLQLSITNNKTVVIIFLSLIAIGLFLSYPYAIEQSYSKFKGVVANKELVSNLMVLQIIESVLGLLFSIFLIRKFYNERVHKIFKWFIYFPGIVIVPTIFYTQSFFFLNFAGLSFQTFAVIIAVCMPLAIWGLRFLVKYLVPEYALRLELKFITHTFQLLVAVIISVLLFSLPTANNYIQQFPIYQTLVFALLIVVFGALGIWQYNRQIKKMNRNFIKQ